MPGSDPDPTAPRLTRGWWIALIIGLGFLGAYGLFNVMVDPTGEFGQSGRHAFNRRPPPSVIAAGEAGGNPAFFTRAIREHRGDVFLIGSSRTWRGFDTCARPDVLRVAGSAWGLRELSRVQRTILATRQAPATLLIEVGLPTTERPAIIDPAEAALSTALSPRMTLFSLQTVTHSLAGDAPQPAGYAPCTARPSSAPNWREAERSARYTLGRLDTTARSLAEGRETLRAMVSEADRLCRTTGLRHTLVFYTLPTTPAGSPAQAHDQRVRANTGRIAAMIAARPPSSAACDIRYLDHASTPPGTPSQPALWRDREHWSDYAHFRPELGSIALETLLPRDHLRSRP